MTPPLNDEEVVKMYKESATEAPSKETDDAILEYAKASRTVDVKPHYVVNWKPIFGLAATIVFVTLLTPWDWVEEPNLIHEEMQLESISPESFDDSMEAQTDAIPTFSSPAPAASQMKEHKNVKSHERMMTDIPELEAQLNPFAQIETLVLEGKKEEATEMLKRLVEENPALEETLPDHLAELLQSE
ncbi:hypothetical protein [Vibrio penaeicida]|uniref:Uncharacterized protein n=1 Tax=Vibrio penaeicida TaxID=104609 RepID=A0AAV5NR14_9VIBR|nr:hypothetical protein [Vibrio penaeicida]RTZ19377.1 hypothetical protein EKN09_27300 [Vibrio penaeicida]GLQ72999.1 hypothetical protein GCM10007932_23590 [Vibrio penaeicida]